MSVSELSTDLGGSSISALSSISSLSTGGSSSLSSMSTDGSSSLSSMSTLGPAGRALQGGALADSICNNFESISRMLAVLGAINWGYTGFNSSNEKAPVSDLLDVFGLDRKAQNVVYALVGVALVGHFFMKWKYPEKSMWSSALALLVLVGGINYAVLAWRMTEKREAGKEQAKEPQDLLAELGEGARPLRVLLYVAIALTALPGFSMMIRTPAKGSTKQ
tara:strand:- start:1766 stop:2425 length:660 start_codon:yes stop_codon:yes gene_type:complete